MNHPNPGSAGRLYSFRPLNLPVDSIFFVVAHKLHEERQSLNLYSR